jgi:Flp pilus assembly pilin Flp
MYQLVNKCCFLHARLTRLNTFLTKHWPIAFIGRSLVLEVGRREGAQRKCALSKFRDRRELASDVRGITSWEYGLIAVLITIAILAGTTSMGLSTKASFGALVSGVNWGK